MGAGISREAFGGLEIPFAGKLRSHRIASYARFVFDERLWERGFPAKLLVAWRSPSRASSAPTGSRHTQDLCSTKDCGSGACPRSFWWPGDPLRGQAPLPQDHVIRKICVRRKIVGAVLAREAFSGLEIPFAGKLRSHRITSYARFVFDERLWERCLPAKLLVAWRSPSRASSAPTGSRHTQDLCSTKGCGSGDLPRSFWWPGDPLRGQAPLPQDRVIRKICVRRKVVGAVLAREAFSGLKALFAGKLRSHKVCVRLNRASNSRH